MKIARVNDCCKCPHWDEMEAEGENYPACTNPATGTVPQLPTPQVRILVGTKVRQAFFLGVKSGIPSWCPLEDA